MYSDTDKHFMSLALQEAHTALAAGDYPVGAALTVNGELWATARNSLFTDGRTTAHAEHNAIYQFSSQLRAKFLETPDITMCLYTTLEPCLMCLGTAVLHRISRIVVACPDPNGGTANLEPSSLGSVYQLWWPTIQIGLYKEQACDLILAFLKTKKFRSWEAMLSEFETMKEAWRMPPPTNAIQDEATGELPRSP